MYSWVAQQNRLYPRVWIPNLVKGKAHKHKAVLLALKEKMEMCTQFRMGELGKILQSEHSVIADPHSWNALTGHLHISNP